MARKRPRYAGPMTFVDLLCMTRAMDFPRLIRKSRPDALNRARPSCNGALSLKHGDGTEMMMLLICLAIPQSRRRQAHIALPRSITDFTTEKYRFIMMPPLHILRSSLHAMPRRPRPISRAIFRWFIAEKCRDAFRPHFVIWRDGFRCWHLFHRLIDDFDDDIRKRRDLYYSL